MADFQPVTIEVPPGFSRKGTTYSKQGRWRDGNLVRWTGTRADGFSLVPVGGWQQITLLDGSGADLLVRGTVRSMHSWEDNLGRTWTAIGTTQGLYIYDGTSLYDITPADITLPGETVGQLLGYGTGNYNTGNYNEPVGTEGDTPSGAAIVYGYWSLDNFGQNLNAVIDSDGRIFEWTPDTPSALATVVATAPTFVRGLCVSNEEILVAIGKNDGSDNPLPRNVSWSNLRDNTVWAPSTTNLAGDIELVSNGVTVRAIRFGNETLIFTNTELHRLIFIGQPGNAYGRKSIAQQCGLVNPSAVAKSADRMVWVSPNGFFQYDGNVVSAVESELFDTPGDAAALLSINGKTSVGHNELFNEFWIYYSEQPGANPTKYIVWNYVQNWWASGDLDRSCWYDSEVQLYPLAAQPYADTEGALFSRLYKHEIGSQRPNHSGVERAESAPIEIGKGGTLLSTQKMMQDSDIDEGARLRIGFDFMLAPNKAPIKTIAPKPLSARGYTDVRGCGRMMVFRITADADSHGKWRVGRYRIWVREEGER